MRLMLLWLRPVAWARERVDQCVAACGWLSKVRASTRSTAASLRRRGVPGRAQTPPVESGMPHNSTCNRPAFAHATLGNYGDLRSSDTVNLG